MSEKYDATRRLRTAQPSLRRQLRDLETEVGAWLMTDCELYGRVGLRNGYLTSTSSQKPIQWSTGFILGCGAS